MACSVSLDVLLDQGRSHTAAVVDDRGAQLRSNALLISTKEARLLKELTVETTDQGLSLCHSLRLHTLGEGIDSLLQEHTVGSTSTQNVTIDALEALVGAVLLQLVCY